MCNGLHTHAELKRDPTQTTTLRNRFEADAYKRLRTIKGRIRDAIIQADGFGLKTNRGRFEFERSSEKVGAFMEWLREQEREQGFRLAEGASVENAANKAWTATYIQTAYQRGIGSAAKKLRGAGVNVEDSWEQNAFNRPIHADRVGLAYTRVYRELQGITEAMDQQISRELAQGLAEGQNPRKIARRLNNRVDKVGITRARTLARTEVISAHAEASINAYQEAGVEGVDVEAEFSTAGFGVCQECSALEGQTYDLNEAKGMIPVHPNCLPGDSLVLSRTDIAAASKRWFDGELVVIRTASGRELSCTPNHPVLTDAGWVAGGSLNIGSNVICDGGSEWAAGVDGDNQDIPAPIHEVAETLLSSSEVVTKPVPVSAPDFHGDGAGSKVAVIGSYRRLWGASDTSGFNRRDNFSLKFGVWRGVFASGLGALTKLSKAALHATNRIVGGLNLISSLLRRHVLPFNRLGFALASNVNTVVNKDGSHHLAVKGNGFGNCVFRFAGFVSSNNIVSESISDLPLGHVSITKDAGNDFMRDAMLASELMSGSACSVFADQVVSIDVVPFSGHVYNLETKGEWYSANGIITHNCRCTLIPQVQNGTGIELS